MPDRSLVTRLRTDGGPSHELLVLLDQHRVLTSDQLARLTGAAARTVTYRLDRLLHAGLIAYARPGREAGSSQRFWWLTPKGSRFVTGTAPMEKRPSALFAAHASTIAEMWLALREHGPAAGLAPARWWLDREAWHDWRHGTAAMTLTPDAAVLAELTAAGGAETVAHIEVDLATMAQTKLRDKVRRYLAYAEDRQWAGRWPHCPPLLLLTTTQARAATFIAAAGKLAAAHRRGRGLDYGWRGYGRAGAEVAHAERLVIAACGLVRAPAAAVTEPVWQLAVDDVDAEPAGPVRLVDLLAERVAAQQVAAVWYARRDAETAAARRSLQLHDVARSGELEQLLGVAAAAGYRRLLGADTDTFTAEHPRLAGQILDWWTRRGQPGDDVRRAELSANLSAVHERLLAGQIRRLLAAPRTAAGHPHAAAAAAQLQQGRLLSVDVLDRLDRPVTRTREQRQQHLLAEHVQQRQAFVDAQLQALGMWARRRADPVALAAAYDERTLLVCAVCGMARPPQVDTDDGRIWAPLNDGDTCRECGHGTLLPYADRGQVPALADRLAELRERLHPLTAP